nr:winged helix-turn-helix domain-containing protein [Frankia sp. AgKG'84/4]
MLLPHPPRRPALESVHQSGQADRGLLCELAMADGRVVTREQLLERVWGYDYFGDSRLLDVHNSCRACQGHRP